VSWATFFGSERVLGVKVTIVCMMIHIDPVAEVVCDEGLLESDISSNIPRSFTILHLSR
jgi:hypothetical protein